MPISKKKPLTFEEEAFDVQEPETLEVLQFFVTAMNEATDNGNDRSNLDNVCERISKELPSRWPNSSRAWILTSQMETSRGRLPEAAYALLRSYAIMNPEGQRAQQAKKILEKVNRELAKPESNP